MKAFLLSIAVVFLLTIGVSLGVDAYIDSNKSVFNFDSSFRFSFSNTTGNTNGTVTGRIRGLKYDICEPGTFQSAKEIEVIIDTYPPVLGKPKKQTGGLIPTSWDKQIEKSFSIEVKYADERDKKKPRKVTEVNLTSAEFSAINFGLNYDSFAITSVLAECSRRVGEKTSCVSFDGNTTFVRNSENDKFSEVKDKGVKFELIKEKDIYLPSDDATEEYCRSRR